MIDINEIINFQIIVCDIDFVQLQLPNWPPISSQTCIIPDPRSQPSCAVPKNCGILPEYVPLAYLIEFWCEVFPDACKASALLNTSNELFDSIVYWNSVAIYE